MLTRLVTDTAKMKIVRRFATAVEGICKILDVQELPANLPDITLPKGTPLRRDFVANRKVWRESKAEAERQGIPLPEAKVGIGAMVDGNAREFKTEESVPADEFREVDTVDYEGYQIKVFERLDLGETRQRFTPIVLKDGKVVRRFFTRSPALANMPDDPGYVAKRRARSAIDAFLKYGRWPEKQGITIPAG